MFIICVGWMGLGMEIWDREAWPEHGEDLRQVLFGQCVLQFYKSSTVVTTTGSDIEQINALVATHPLNQSDRPLSVEDGMKFWKSLVPKDQETCMLADIKAEVLRQVKLYVERGLDVLRLAPPKESAQSDIHVHGTNGIETEEIANTELSAKDVDSNKREPTDRVDSEPNKPDHKDTRTNKSESEEPEPGSAPTGSKPSKSESEDPKPTGSDAKKPETKGPETKGSERKKAESNKPEPEIEQSETAKTHSREEEHQKSGSKQHEPEESLSDSKEAKSDDPEPEKPHMKANTGELKESVKSEGPREPEEKPDKQDGPVEPAKSDRVGSEEPKEPREPPTQSVNEPDIPETIEDARSRRRARRRSARTTPEPEPAEPAKPSRTAEEKPSSPVELGKRKRSVSLDTPFGSLFESLYSLDVLNPFIEPSKSDVIKQPVSLADIQSAANSNEITSIEELECELVRMLANAAVQGSSGVLDALQAVEDAIEQYRKPKRKRN